MPVRRVHQKIRQVVVIAAMIHVMHNLFRFQITAEVLLHHEAMFSHVTMTVCMRMIWTKH